MKVLWTSNVLFQEVREDLKLPASSAGGWMGSLANLIKNEVELCVLTISKNKELFKVLNGILFIVLPDLNAETWKEVTKRFRPDIIHIHGTEFPYSLKVKDLSSNIPCVVSIQGLVGECAKYWLAGVDTWSLIKNITIKDTIRHTSSFNARKDLQKRGLKERNLLKRTNYVIGRTSWDNCHVREINNSVCYYKCNEVLRDTFYEGLWDYSRCVKHSIFCTSNSVPLKGAHILLKAASIIKKIYPDFAIRIVGRDIIKIRSIKEWFQMSDYQWSLHQLIKKNGLADNIVFLGELSAEGIKSELLASNVFVVPSNIENSSNSLCEAQMLGVPVIASYVGGTPSLMPGALQEMLYRFDDAEMLAMKIIDTFETKNWEDYSRYVQGIARERHEKQGIKDNLLLIYKRIVGGNDK